MKTHRTWMFAFASLCVLAAGPAFGQTSFGPAPPMGYGPSPIQQVSHSSCGACNGAGCTICGEASNSYRDVVGSSCYGGSCGSGNCGGGACGPGGGGLLAHGLAMQHLHAMHGDYGGSGMVRQNGPQGCGGCCAPMWYDLHIEYMNLTRDDVGGNVDLTSQNAGGPIVLNTDMLDPDSASGIRATYAIVIGPSTNIEASYFGTEEWDSSASASGAGDLFSVFSEFGTEFFGGIQGFPQTVDFANLHTLDWSSELHSVEVNVRRRWVSANCLLHGSFLGGVRYVSLQEFLNHATEAASGGSLNYDLETNNDAWGVQIGTDMYACISPRFKIGFEIEVGLYGNDASQDTLVTGIDSGVTPINPVVEHESETDAAFIGEAGLIGIFRVTPRCSIRGGYQVMHMDGMALASENFNTDYPFNPRTPFIANSGEVVMHGGTLGLTFTW